MSQIFQFKIAPTLDAPVKKIRFVVPNHVANLQDCECHVNIGFFFDGTKNNYEVDLPHIRHTNIARLFDTYRSDIRRGYSRVYVPGVGTNFPEIGEFGESDWGQGFGMGCEARVLFAMLELFNALHKIAFNGKIFFNGDQTRTLCSKKDFFKMSHDERTILRILGANSGILMPDFFGKGNRDEFFKSQARRLENKLKSNEKPKIKECFLDIFGFSRGAAEARVFCSWVDKLLIDGKLAGVPIRFRFVGIIDTVAAAGFWSGVGSGITNSSDGHSGWAGVEYLRLPKNLENCVHMVAMHEIRRNFPIDQVNFQGTLPPNTQEVIYPGAHSDVGGGYAICELGVSVGESFLESDSLKLSQIPLNHMFKCAAAAGAPMEIFRAVKMVSFNPVSKKNVPIPIRYDPFKTSEIVSKAYEDFILSSGVTPRHISEWMQPYLNWRWQNRSRHSELLHVRRANEEDRKILRRFNGVLIRDADLIERISGVDKAAKIRAAFGIQPFTEKELVVASYLDKEAKVVLDSAKNAPVVAAPVQHLFDNFVHDGLAGFNSVVLEPTGYWRYRKGFVGGHASGIVMSEQKNDGDLLA